MAAAGLLAGLVVGALTVDWGPVLRGRAEREASRLIERPLHIGRLSTNLLRGRFTFDDLVIEGLTPDATPFFKAKRIVVLMPWWTAFRREVFIESVTLTDWTMQVETYPNGRHNFVESREGDPRTGRVGSSRPCSWCAPRAASSSTGTPARLGAPSRATST